MNPEFANQQKQVLALLEVLAKQAKQLNGTLVFIGGSAVQVSLHAPQRLSIDLDVYFDGKPEDLLTVLEPEYKITQRPVRREDLFSFFRATKNQTLVKIDISRFTMVEHEKPFTLRKLKNDNGEFSVNVASLDFLLAAKLSSLAVGTIGRKPDQKDFFMNYVKDIFDANCLLDETPFSKKTIALFEQLITKQNQIRNTNYSFEQAVESIQKTIQAMVKSDSIKGTLQSFNQYLIRTPISKPGFIEFEYRVLACSKALENNSPTAFSAIEKTAQTEYANRKTLGTLEQALLQKGLDKNHVHELKILTPKAMLYLYAFHYPDKIK